MTKKLTGFFLTLSVFGILASVFTFQNCGNQMGSMDHSSLTLNQLNHSLDTLTANKACHNDSDCDVLSVGRRACGGPSRFVVISLAHTDKNTIDSLISEITRREEQSAIESGALSTCEVLVPPDVQCLENRCQYKKPK